MKNELSQKFYIYVNLRKWLMNPKNTYEHDLVILDFAERTLQDQTLITMLKMTIHFKWECLRG